LKVCEEISSILPEYIVPDFDKGKHLQFSEALLKLQEKLGKHISKNFDRVTVFKNNYFFINTKRNL
jgi:hypothetical protein